MSKIKDKIKNFKNYQLEKHQQDIEERRKYLQFCESEAERIYIFKYRIAGLVAEKFRDEGLEIKLFNFIGIVKIYIAELDDRIEV